jgi:hypothetical protein
MTLAGVDRNTGRLRTRSRPEHFSVSTGLSDAALTVGAGSPVRAAVVILLRSDRLQDREAALLHDSASGGHLGRLDTDQRARGRC